MFLQLLDFQPLDGHIFGKNTLERAKTLRNCKKDLDYIAKNPYIC
jgi:hypothetical protein